MKTFQSRLRDCLIAAFLVGTALYAGPLRADVTPPEQVACEHMAAGARCDKGTCQNSTCYRLDYAHWNRDASTSPPSAPYDCIACVPKGTSQDGSVGSKDKDDSRCSLGSASAAGAFNFAWLIGAAALVRRRRR